MTVQVRSFAKINLGLRIGESRADGFHELLTVYQTIALHDVIRVSMARGSGIEIRCADPRVPRDGSNTCYRIVERAMEALGAKRRVIIEIEKRLPVQGGLGGASSNAVATLLGIERALKKGLPTEEKLRIAAEVGSDPPLFLVGGTVLGVGRGEQVYPLPDLPAMPCVVVTPDVGVSTPKAFVGWDRRISQGLKPESSQAPDAALKGRSSTTPGERSVKKTTAEPRPAGQPGVAVPTRALAVQQKLTLSDTSDRMVELSRGLSAWLSELHSGAPSGIGGGGRAGNPLLRLVRAGIENDFERVVFPEYPELREGKSALLRAGAKYASLSGSGSALYGLFVSKAAAASAVARLWKQGWTAQATSTLPRGAYWNRILR
ncbi:MAG: 4-(cytidine 5'-diphospho)-2-C-methyl-D-erythritol kinase [Candidatus Sulfotelmatobacter sp.]